MKSLVGFATRWGSLFGGINSFNTDLLRAVATAYERKIAVACVVPTASREEIEAASKANVQLISIECSDEEFSCPGTVTRVSLELRRGVEFGNTVWIGHDRVTGKLAIEAARAFGGSSAVVHHMSYAHYEAFAESSSAAFRKVEEQREIFSAADRTFAVGPLLQDALSDIAELTSPATMLIPGLPEIKVAEAPRSFSAYLSGRVSENATRLKQAHLGVAGFAESVRLAEANVGLPDAIHPSSEPRLLVRGIATGGARLEGGVPEAEDTLKRFAEKYAHRALNILVLPFTQDREELYRELRRSSVALMPSWHEGFGLVGWEAVGSGVPLIVSAKSGLYRFLQGYDEGVYASLVLPIDVRGTSDYPYFRPDDLEDLATAIIRVAKAPAEYRRRAARLREALAVFTWSHCAETLVRGLGWELERGHLADRGASPEPLTLQPTPVASTLEPWANLPVRVWSLENGLSESHLLRAEESKIPFDPAREPFFAEQLAWASDDSFALSIRLIVGPGGAGKTRLALELCRRLKIVGWSVGLLKSNLDEAAHRSLARAISESDSPTLIVVDYAEARQSAVADFAEHLLRLSLRKTRILLLARDGGEWWEQLAERNPTCQAIFSGRAASGPFAIPPLHPEVGERIDAFRLAASIFSAQLKVDAPVAEPDLRPTHFEHPLFIQMAALSALSGESSVSAEGLPRALISHEERYWKLAAVELTPPLSGAQVSTLMALVTIVGGIEDWSTLKHVWISNKIGSALDLKNAHGILHALYPSAGRYGVEALRPDVLGESLVAKTLLGRDGASLLSELLKSCGKRERQAALAFIARLVSRRADLEAVVEDALVNNFMRCAPELFEACCQSNGPLSEIAVRAFDRLSPGFKMQAATLLEPYFSKEVVPLSTLDLRISQLLAAQKKRKASLSEKHLRGYVHAMSSLSLALARCANYEQALQVDEEAMRIAARLNETNSERNAYLWASCLNGHANRLIDVGREDEALAFVRDALDIREKLAIGDPQRYEDDLAVTLVNFSNRVNSLGMHDEAMSHVVRAISICERHLELESSVYLPILTAALANYSAYLINAGRFEEANEYDARAYKSYERLTKENPGAFEDEWASTIHNRADTLSKIGEYEKAFALNAKAMEIVQGLARWRPQKFNPAVAREYLVRAYIRLAIGPSAESLDDLERASEALNSSVAIPAVIQPFQLSILMLTDLARWLLRYEAVSADKVRELEASIASLKGSPRKRLELEHVLALLLFCSSDDVSSQARLRDRALKTWMAMGDQYQRDHELGLLIFAFDGVATVEGLPESASLRLKETLDRRGNRVPWWIQEVGRRKRLLQ